MAVVPKLTINKSDDCKNLYASDSTGIYDPLTNTGGFGTPNNNVTDALSCTIVITKPDGTILPSINVFPSLPNLNGVVFKITNVMLGLGVNDKIPDGAYSFKYTMTMAGSSPFTTTVVKLLHCNADCCWQNIVSKTKVGDCCNECRDTFLNALVSYTLMKDSACCGKTNEALEHLTAFQAICDQMGCGCSPC